MYVHKLFTYYSTNNSFRGWSREKFLISHIFKPGQIRGKIPKLDFKHEENFASKACGPQKTWKNCPPKYFHWLQKHLSSDCMIWVLTRFKWEMTQSPRENGIQSPMSRIFSPVRLGTGRLLEYTYWCDVLFWGEILSLLEQRVSKIDRHWWASCEFWQKENSEFTDGDPGS